MNINKTQSLVFILNKNIITQKTNRDNTSVKTFYPDVSNGHVFRWNEFMLSKDNKKTIAARIMILETMSAASHPQTPSC